MFWLFVCLVFHFLLSLKFNVKNFNKNDARDLRNNFFKCLLKSELAAFSQLVLALDIVFVIMKCLHSIHTYNSSILSQKVS